ncbi:odorant receptor 13a-like isoform X1 [Venturia canescens]|uniref:odorant receptor 13a-like isoform X1 n=1 Tax=Venturia canescens TaxID=32260 RepID=UPI001C9D2C35|nr:odorant receptor 13a-like isoform X1 [Venturia canescens]
MAMIMLHLVGQLETVKIALNNIVDEKSLKDPSIYWKRFSTIVQKHEELNRRAGMIEDSFNFMLLVQVVNCSILFCFQGYVIITTFLEGLTGDEEFPFLQMMFFICFASTGIIHLFVYCWASDLLVVESTSLSYAAYESQWYLLKPNEARSLMMLTYRARIPLEITAGKFVGFSLELFTTIMKTSMGYLSVLLAVEKS